MTTQAYVNHGRWIADCTDPDCGNAESLELGQSAVLCTNCQALHSVEWPPDAVDIDMVLERRPVPQTRNWSPAGHRQSLAVGMPQGQTVLDLIRENEGHKIL